jgi:hypothetical protein
MTTLKTSHMAILGALILLLANGENIRSLSARTTATTDRKTLIKDRLKTEKDRAKDAGNLSKVALERYKSNCILVVDSTSKTQSYFTPGASVIDTALGKPLRDNAMICNTLGDTAIVTNGVIENIASIATEDLPQFTAILESRGYHIAMPTIPTPQPPKHKTPKGSTDV